MLVWRGVTKSFGRRKVSALDSFDLEVERGEMVVLLGRNGSGKSTAIKVAAGLVRAQEGTVTVLGQPVPGGLGSVAGRMGSVVDGQRFLGAFTPTQELRILAAERQVPFDRVDEVLELVGLSDDAGGRVSTFSLGMKHRLLLATVLLGSPELLLLDEPFNAIDAVGARQMRGVLHALRGRGCTVVVASHVLSDFVDEDARIAIVERGRVTRTETLRTLLSTASVRSAVIAVSDIRGALAALELAGWAASPESDGRLRVVLGPRSGAELNRDLVAAGHYVSELMVEDLSDDSLAGLLDREIDAEPTRRAS